ncbi:MAG: hypothetical protein H0U52_14300 [Chloroflexi bacterium]|nr:hypothetical protein [Chloroflexota bacterium]
MAHTRWTFGDAIAAARQSRLTVLAGNTRTRLATAGPAPPRARPLNSYGYSGQSFMYGPIFNGTTTSTHNAANSATGNTIVN